MVALIEQGIRLTAAAAQAGNFIVQFGDLLAVAVDLVSAVAELLVNAAVHIAQVFVGVIELIDQPIGLAQHRLARGVIAGVADQVLQVAEEILHIGRQGIGFARQQVINLRDFLEVGVLCPGLALCSTQLIGDELVVLAVNAGHGDPVANEACRL